MRTRFQRLGILLSVLLPLPVFAQSAPWNSASLPLELPCNEAIPPMSFELSPQYRLENAFMLLGASALAEVMDRKAILQGIQHWGLADGKLIGRPKRGSFGFLAADPNFHLLSFRGTNSFGEAFANSFFLTTSFESIGFAGFGHRGMMHHFRQLLQESDALLKTRDPEQKKPLVLTGHSLGGAMALLHALHFAKAGWKVAGVYTSGQPHVGDAAFYEDVAQWLPDRYFRMETATDLTPRIPPTTATATVFGELLPDRISLLQGRLMELVGWMNYGVASGPALHIGSTFRLESAGDEAQEIQYWEKLRGSMGETHSLPSLVSALSKRMEEHPPRQYMCAFLKAWRTLDSGRL